MSDTIKPELVNWDGPMGLPHFEAIESGHFAAAFEIALKQDRAEITASAGTADDPTFDNTVTALELYYRRWDRQHFLQW
ncbi:MAG: peptidase M3, partial [Pseudomonadota bacterium]